MTAPFGDSPSPLKTLIVGLGERSYPIHIGTNLLASADLFAAAVTGRQAMIVSNDLVAPDRKSVV